MEQTATGNNGHHHARSRVRGSTGWVNIVQGLPQERVTGGRWRRIVLGDVLADRVGGGLFNPRNAFSTARHSEYWETPPRPNHFRGSTKLVQPGYEAISARLHTHVATQTVQHGKTGKQHKRPDSAFYPLEVHRAMRLLSHTPELPDL